MRDLLSEGFYRLFRNKAFWCVLAFEAAYKTYSLLHNWCNVQRLRSNGTNAGIPFDELLYEYAGIALLTSCILIPLLIGGDYADGTLRHRLIKGYRRTSVYLANWLVSTGGMLLCVAADWLISFTLGMVLQEEPISSPAHILLMLTIGVGTVTACCSVNAFVVMLIPHKTVAGAVCFCILALTVLVGMRIYDALSLPEYWYDYVVSTSDGFRQYDMYPNPHYVSGSRRQVCLFVYDFLPFTQSFELAANSLYGNPVRMLLCSLGITAASTVGGMAAFVRKDIR